MAIKQLSRDNFGIQQARFVLSGLVLPLAVGGTETVIEQDGKFYRVHTFTDVGESQLEVLRGGEFEYLVVAGGGSAGRRVGGNGGGGGAGGLLRYVASESSGSDTSPLVLTVGTVSIAVGGGGIGPEATTSGPGVNGDNSALGSLTAIGGGGGGQGNIDGGVGGSGGGGGLNSSGDNGVGGSGIIGQGFAGGNPLYISSNSRATGGGGGAGGVGGNAPNASTPGTGGAGITSSITGSFVTYATGGRGSRQGGTNETPLIPDANSGNGGQATSGDNTRRPGGNGGSGIVIVRYQISRRDFIESGGVIA